MSRLVPVHPKAVGNIHGALYEWKYEQPLWFNPAHIVTIGEHLDDSGRVNGVAVTMVNGTMFVVIGTLVQEFLDSCYRGLN